MIIGQDELIKLVDTYTLDNTPHSIILVGEEGCGKHTLIKYLSKKLNVKTINLDKSNLNLEYLDEMLLRVEPYIYVIDGNKLTIADQNTLLKFIEEPLINSIFIIYVNNKRRLLKTVTNRCHILNFKPYKRLY